MLLKKIAPHIISKIPTNFLRVTLYNKVLGYKIKNSKIGYGTVISVKDFEVSDSYIGKKNIFYGPIKVSIKDNCRISDHNEFHCGYWLNENELEKANLYLLGEVNITSKHFFDLSGGISIGKGSWIAGRSSQFWTHGAGQRPEGINIGNECYIGSSVKIIQGVNISHSNTIAIGSIVNKSFTKRDTLIAGCPAIEKKQNYKWKNNT